MDLGRMQDLVLASPVQNLYDFSVESPYTSLGSRATSYNSMLLSNTKDNVSSTRPHNSLNTSNYLSLRAKAEEGHAKYESRTKAVMNALQSLQTKIRKIESDRTNAELNLKCLALETKDYKELLKQKHSLGENTGVTKDTQSKELENQLEHAQGRCLILEKQLESMRKMMTIHSSPKAATCVLESTRNKVEANRQYKNSSAHKPLNETSANTSAIEKLNDLEKEHERFSLTQSQTEEKINQLEKKLRKEEHHRKMLQDKTRELQNVLGAKKKIESVSTPSPQAVKKKRRRKPSKSIPTDGKATPVQPSEKSPSSTSHSPSHYLVDFSNIPFVVGKSTSKSHSLGANIQSVLSIMKSHNMLCCDESPKSCVSAHSKCKPKQSQLLGSCVHLEDLLTTLQDEFAQLGFEHRDIISQLKSSSNARTTKKLEKEKVKATERMEAKAKQIRIIQEHLEKVRLAEKEKKLRKSRKENRIAVKNAETVEVVTTVRRSPEVKTNPNLDMLKKVKKLQSTLCKDDLKWV